MNWTELIHAVSERSGVSRAQTKAVLSATTDIITEQLTLRETVALRGVGVLSTRWLKGRTLRSIDSGRRMWLGGRFVPSFRPSSTLKSVLLEQEDQSWRDPALQQAWRFAETLIGDLELYHADQAPKELQHDLDEAATRAALEGALGPAWAQAVRAYEEKVPAEVRASQDFLVMAARRHWGARP